MAHRICLIYNFAQHYRTNIFTLMDQNMDIDFVFGDHYLNVKKMNYDLLQNTVREVRNIELGPIVWQKGTVRLVFMGYRKYILLGEPMNLSSWIILLLARLIGKEVYFWTHGWYGKETKVKAFVKKLYFRMANGIMLYGNYARQLMIDEGFSSKKLTTIHNSLMYDDQLPIRKELMKSNLFVNHFGNNYPTVIFVGRLTPIKKLDLLLRAQAINRANRIKYNVALIGDGEVREMLVSLVTELKLDNLVWFYGATYDEKELSQILYDADLCVAPGNIGLTAMHAMVYGCPCISHNDFKWQMPEFEAIKEGVTGSFFERDNPNSLADSIGNWLTTHINDRERVRNACFREIDENWNPHKQLDIIMRAIGE